MIALSADWGLVIVVTIAAAAHLPLALLLPLMVGALPWFTPSNEGLTLLASPGPAIAGGLLLANSLFLRRTPGLRELWQALLALATLPAAALVAQLVLASGQPSDMQLLASLAAILLATPILGVRLGSGAIRRWTADRPGRHRLLRSRLAPAAAAGGLIVIAMAEWTVLALPALLLVLVGIVRMHSELRACVFLMRIVTGIVAHVTGARGWQGSGKLPAWVKDRSESTDELRGVPAGLASARERPRFRSGWLVSEPRGTRFVYRTFLQVWEIDLASAEHRESLSEFWGVRWPLTLDGSEHVLVLPRHASDLGLDA